MSTSGTKQQQLEQIKADILKKNICPDLAKSAKNLVMGDGNPGAEIVFIGEAPGKKEDEQGLPFVGAAGKFLDEMLASINLKRSDVYITNIVKYRPPNNRDPLPEEKVDFLPFLQKQLVVIQPKLIVTLGRHSMETLLPGLKISECHGQPKRIHVKRMAAGGSGVDALQDAGEKRTEPYQEYGEGASEPATQQSAAKGGKVSGSAGKQADLTWVILPLFHPAAALYNGGMRQTLIDDFAKIPKVLALLNAPKQGPAKPIQQGEN